MKIFAQPLLIFALMTYAPVMHGQSGLPEIRITISKGQFTNLQNKGERMTLKSPVFLIDGDTAVIKEVHSRGNNSLTFEHKSLSVELDKAFTLIIDGAKNKIKKFDLLNLVMDKNLWHNRWAYLAMSEVGIFPLANTFCTLWINNQPQGIYLLVEKPQHYTASIKSPYMMRRGVDNSIHNEYTETSSKEESKRYKRQYLDLYADIEKYKEKELYDQLSKKLELNHYFEWLAFNYLIMNGDYADELFLYIKPGSGLFDVIPWDYDDILLRAPHEGAETRNAVPGFKYKYIFSSEDPLDRAIASNEYIYKQYLISFTKLMTALPPETLTKISEKVMGELDVVSKNQDIVKASLFLGRDSFQPQVAKEDIIARLNFLIVRRNGLLEQVGKP